jgi:hypothetical protein
LRIICVNTEVALCYEGIEFPYSYFVSLCWLLVIAKLQNLPHKHATTAVGGFMLMETFLATPAMA